MYNTKKPLYAVVIGSEESKAPSHRYYEAYIFSYHPSDFLYMDLHITLFCLYEYTHEYKAVNL